MTRFDWNFAPRRWWSRPCLAVCIVGLSGCLHAVWWRHQLLQQRESIVEQARDASRRINGQRQRVAAPPPPALNQVFAEMRYPWTDMLDSLQHATPSDVHLLSLEPDPGAIRRVHVSGVATRAQNVFDLVTALQHDPSWSSIRLISQTRGNDTSELRNNSPASVGFPGSVASGVSFSLVAEWGRP